MRRHVTWDLVIVIVGQIYGDGAPSSLRSMKSRNSHHRDSSSYTDRVILFVLHRIQSTQHKTTIMFTGTCYDTKESSSGYVRTIYVYKVAVRILGS